MWHEDTTYNRYSWDSASALQETNLKLKYKMKREKIFLHVFQSKFSFAFFRFNILVPVLNISRKIITLVIQCHILICSRIICALVSDKSDRPSLKLRKRKMRHKYGVGIISMSLLPLRH